MVTLDQKLTFFHNGWVVLPNIIPEKAVLSAARMLYQGYSDVWYNALTSLEREKASPESINSLDEAIERSRKMGGDQSIRDLVDPKSSLIRTINQMLGQPMIEPRRAQLAAIFPRQPSHNINEAGYPANEVPFYGWHGHLDGLWNGGAPMHQRVDRPMNDQEWALWNRDPGRNGVSRTFENKDANVMNFTALLGIPLSDQTLEGSGNLGLLSGAHHHMSRFFREQRRLGGPIGPDGPNWERIDTSAPNGCGLRHYPDQVREKFVEDAQYTSDGHLWPKPDFVKVKPGDAVLVLHSVPHSSSRLERSSPRLMVYFRLLSSIRQKPNLMVNADALCNPWIEWEGMTDVVLEEIDS